VAGGREGSQSCLSLPSFQPVPTHFPSRNMSDLNSLSCSLASQSPSASGRIPKIRQHYRIASTDSEDNDPRLQCRHCPKFYAQSTGSSILARHLRRHHPDTVRTPDPHQATLPHHFLMSETKKKALLEKLYNWMIANLQNCSVVENPEFIDLMKEANPAITLPVRQTARQHISCKFDVTRAIIVDRLQDVDYCSLTTDCWTSVGSHQFLSLTCHYLDKSWGPRSLVLDCIPFDQPHTGEGMRETIARLLEEFGLVGKVCAITTDSASNMVAAMRELASEMGAAGQEMMHVRCGAHMLHRIVMAGLESECPAIAEIRASVARIRASPRLLELLNGFQAGPNKVRPILDVCTRWNSTFEMLARALELKAGINAINASRGTQISESSWDAAARICRFLDLFNDATQTLSAESAPTIALTLIVFHHIRVHVREALACPELANMAAPMMAKIESYADFYGDARFAAVSLLDPRIRPVLEKYDRTACINGRRVLEEWFSALGGGDEAARVVDDGAGLEAVLLGHRGQMNGSELERFFDHASMSHHVKPLQWWTANESVFPTLGRLARKCLTMQATSVPSERLFSAAGMILTSERNRLLPESARELICLQNWIGVLRRQ
jgi:hypothetical protein